MPSSSRIAEPRSKSAPISSGNFERACNWLVSTAVGYAWLLIIPSGDNLRDVDESADVQIVDVVHHLAIRGGIGGGKAPVISGEKELADFFVIGHLAAAWLPPIACSPPMSST